MCRAKTIDLEAPTPFVESGMLALHPERRRKIGYQGVQATADLVRRITSTEVTTENQNIILNSCQPISVWSYDMDGHAEKGSQGTASLLKKVSALKPAEAPCTDG